MRLLSSLIILIILSSCGGGGGGGNSSTPVPNPQEPIDIILSLDNQDISLTRGDSFSLQLDTNINIQDFSINPSLPGDIVFNPNNGSISGIATVISPRTNYTITHLSSGESTSFFLEVLEQAITLFNYNITNNFLTGDNLSLTPIYNGDNILFSSLDIPNNFSLNETTGVITSNNLLAGNYSFTIIATNSLSSLNFIVNLEVNELAPQISYSPEAQYLINNNYTLNVNSIGGVVSSYRILNSPPINIDINDTTGEITFSSFNEQNIQIQILAENNTSSFITTFNLNIINPNPRNLTYQNNYEIDRFSMINIAPLNFTGEDLTFNITPSLPMGLSINENNGVISGTPSEVSSSTLYNVTISNSFGSDSFSFTLSINEIIPK